MRVLYDGQMYTTQHAGGVNRWFQRLIEGLPPEWEPILSTAQRRDIHFPAHPRLRVIHWQRYGFRPGRLSYWLEKFYFRREYRSCRPDILHPTTYDLLTRMPIAAHGIPYVVTVYDMIHEIFPEAMDPDGSMARMKREAILSASAVVCISEKTRADLLTRIPVPEKKVSVIYLAPGIDGSHVQANAAVPTRPFFLHVGSRAAGYKNFDRLLRAFARFCVDDRDAVLAVVGQPFNEQEKAWMAALPLEERVIHLGVVDDGVLASLYKSSIALVYPSRYEGFGIPPLEAMACGGVVVAADAGSVPEIVGDAALLFAPEDDEDLLRALRTAATDRGRAEDLRTKGRKRASEFTWADTVRRTIAVYERVHREATA